MVYVAFICRKQPNKVFHINYTWITVALSYSPLSQRSWILASLLAFSIPILRSLFIQAFVGFFITVLLIVYAIIFCLFCCKGKNIIIYFQIFLRKSAIWVRNSPLFEHEAEGGEELDEEDGYDDEGSAFCDA